MQMSNESQLQFIYHQTKREHPEYLTRIIRDCLRQWSNKDIIKMIMFYVLAGCPTCGCGNLTLPINTILNTARYDDCICKYTISNTTNNTPSNTIYLGYQYYSKNNSRYISHYISEYNSQYNSRKYYVQVNTRIKPCPLILLRHIDETTAITGEIPLTVMVRKILGVDRHDRIDNICLKYRFDYLEEKLKSIK